MGERSSFPAFLPSLARPRPNGSRALEETVREVRAWLQREGTPVEGHRFILRPYFMEWLGVWMAFTGLLLPAAALGRWGWWGLIVALLALGVPLAETRFLFPTVTALIRRPAENLVVSFPAPRPKREAILCAHLDSKTELLDHVQRERLLRLGRPAMGLALTAGGLTFVASLVPAPAAQLLRWAAFAAALPTALYGLAMAANLVGGRFSRHPSTGAVDDGAAVAVLLELARRSARGELRLEHTHLTLLFTVGEEAQMQGALAYVRDRKEWPLPACVVNLEVMGQNGGYLLWDQDGTAMVRLPADPALNGALERAVEAVTGERPFRVPLINSDGFAFLRQGIPAATLGSFDLELGGRGLHSAMDSPDRLDPGRMEEAVEVLSRFLEGLDRGE